MQESVPNGWSNNSYEDKEAGVSENNGNALIKYVNLYL